MALSAALIMKFNMNIEVETELQVDGGFGERWMRWFSRWTMWRVGRIWTSSASSLEILLWIRGL